MQSLSRSVEPCAPKDGSLCGHPLTIAQQQWSMAAFTPAERQWQPVLFRAVGNLQVEFLRAAYSALLGRHPALRTTCVTVEGKSRQIVGSERSLEVVDLRHLSPDAQNVAFSDYLAPFFSIGSPLEPGGVHAQLWRMSEREYLLSLLIHHINYDHASHRILQRELFGGYFRTQLGIADAHSSVLAYGEYAEQENRWLTAAQLEVLETRWREPLEAVERLNFPRSAEDGDARSEFAFGFQGDVIDEIVQNCRNRGTTLGVAVLAAIAVVLAKWTRRPLVSFGIYARCRPPAFEGTIGCFVQIRPFMLDLSDNPTTEDVLARARSSYVRAADLRNPVPPSLLNKIPGNVLVNYISERSSGPRRQSRSDTAEGGGREAPTAATAQAELFAATDVRFERAYFPLLRPSTALRDLNITCEQRPSWLSVSFTSLLGVISQVQRDQLSEQFLAVLTALTADGASRIDDLLA